MKSFNLKVQNFSKKFLKIIDILVENATRFAVVSTIIGIIISLPNLPIAIIRIFEAGDNFLFPEKAKIKIATEQVAKFRPNINLEWYEDYLKVKLIFVNKYKAKTFNLNPSVPQNSVVNCQENIYLTEYYWLKIIKKDEDIVYTSVTSRDKKFQPEVLFEKIGNKYSTNSSGKPKIKFIVNMKYVEYYETYYGGNPTLYQDMFIGHSASGFAPFEDYDFFLQIENAETDKEGFLDMEKLSIENRKKLEDFRKNNIYNTVGFSSESEFNTTNFNLKTGCVNSDFTLNAEYNKAINIGPSYLLTRFVN